jgi:hypothetical protein
MLTLKVITHRGLFSTYNVKEFNQLIGSDVITAHQLMKNDIPLHEYWLVTDSFLRDQSTHDQLPENLQWEKGSKQTQSGQVDYFYSMLTHLKKELKDPGPEQFGIRGKRVQVLSLQREYDENIERLFAVLGDLTRRPQWLKGLKAVKNISSGINHVGTSHQCILDKSIEIMTTSDFYSDDAMIVLEETDQKKTYANRFELVKKAEDKTLLTLHTFLKQDFFMTTMFNLFMKKKFAKDMQQSMENLAMFLKTNEAAACHC